MIAVLSQLGIKDAFRQVIAAHPVATVVAVLLGGFILLNAAVQTLDEPTEHDGKLYRKLYRFAHLVAFNFQYALRAKFPEYIPPDTAPPKV